MSRQRRRFSRKLQAKMALEALWGERALQEIAAQHQVHPSQVGARKRPAIEGLAEVFSKGAERRNRDHESEIRDLHAKIGELIVEMNFRRAGSVDELVGAAHDGRPPSAKAEPAVSSAVDRTPLVLRRTEGRLHREAARGINRLLKNTLALLELA